MSSSNQRDKIVRATAALFRKRGYAATGLGEIVSVSGAPKGSLYHYFPNGKEQIAAEAVRYAGDKVRATLSKLDLSCESAAELIRAYGGLLAGWMAQSAFQDGCPITTTLLETAPVKANVTRAGREAFEAWTAIIAAKLVSEGMAKDRSESLARFAFMALEGALIFARVEASAAPILDAAEEVARTFEREGLSG